METIATPPQLPQTNIIDLNHHRRSAYWLFVIGFLGIISFAILGLYAISAYERNQQARVDAMLNNTATTRFFPSDIEN